MCQKTHGHPPWCRESCGTICLPTMSERVRHGLHLQPASHGPTGLVGHTLYALGAPDLSPFVASVAAPCRASLSLQLIEKKARRKCQAVWHRFCLLWKE